MSESKQCRRTGPRLDDSSLCGCGLRCQQVRSYLHSYTKGCACTLGPQLVCVCTFKAAFAFHGFFGSLIKRRSTKGRRKIKRSEAIVLQKRMFVCKQPCFNQMHWLVNSPDHREHKFISEERRKVLKHRCMEQMEQREHCGTHFTTHFILFCRSNNDSATTMPMLRDISLHHYGGAYLSTW